MAPTLGYWNIRGLAHAIRLALHYKEVEFEDKKYQQGEAPEFSRESWLKEKFELGLELPNLPYYMDGETKITETSAIYGYIGRKYNLCGSTEEARIRNDMSYSLQISNRMPTVSLFYNKDFETLKVAFIEALPTRVETLSKWLGEHTYFGGSELVISDFALYDLLEIWNTFNPGCIDKHDNLKAYMKRISELPTLKSHLASDAGMKKGPFNGAIASWGDKAFD